MSERLGLAMIVSRQLVPHLVFANRYLPENPSQVVVIHTKHEQESKEPAERLAAYLREKGAEVSLECTGEMPYQVADSIRRISTKADRWILDMAGGLKLMALGLLGAISDPRFTVVYPEIGSGWIRVLASGDGLTAEKAGDLDNALLDRAVSPSELISLHLRIGSGQQVWSAVPKTSPTPAEVLQRCDEGRCSIADCLRENWIDPQQDGKWLEVWTYILLKHLGSRPEWEIKWGVPRHDEREELDIAFVGNGRLHIVDCTTQGHARENKKAGPIFRETYTKRRLGGLDCRYLVMRSAAKAKDWLPEMLETIGASYLGPEAMPDLASKLHEWIHPNKAVPEEVKAIDARVLSLLDRHVSLFG